MTTVYRSLIDSLLSCIDKNIKSEKLKKICDLKIKYIRDNPDKYPTDIENTEIVDSCFLISIIKIPKTPLVVDMDGLVIEDSKTGIHDEVDICEIFYTYESFLAIFNSKKNISYINDVETDLYYNRIDDSNKLIKIYSTNCDYINVLFMDISLSKKQVYHRKNTFRIKFSECAKKGIKILLIHIDESISIEMLNIILSFAAKYFPYIFIERIIYRFINEGKQANEHSDYFNYLVIDTNTIIHCNNKIEYIFDNNEEDELSSITDPDDISFTVTNVIYGRKLKLNYCPSSKVCKVKNTYSEKYNNLLFCFVKGVVLNSIYFVLLLYNIKYIL